MNRYAYSKAFCLLFTLLWMQLSGCFKSSPERSNPLDPAVEVDPFQLRADPFYGEIQLRWESPPNIRNPRFNIYRRQLGSGDFRIIKEKHEFHAYTDALFLIPDYYNKDFVYKIAAVSDASSDTSKNSQTKTARPYPIPDTLKFITDPNTRFQRGFPSDLDPPRMYVLDNNNGTIKAFNISSDPIEHRKWRLKGRKAIEDFAIARVDNTEYILAVSTRDSSINFCKVEEDSLSPLRQLPYQPSAIASSGKSDGLIYVALHQIEQNAVHVFKINFLTGNLIRQKQFPGNRINFMICSKDSSNLVVLSDNSNNNIYVLDKDLDKMNPYPVGNRPKNISFSLDSKFLFVCCQESHEVYSFRVMDNSLEPAGILRSTVTEDFIWVDSSEGEAADILLFNLVYNQGLSTKFRVDIYQAQDGLKSVQKVRSLLLPDPILLGQINSIKYVRKPAWKLWNLYLFAGENIYYFLP